MVNFTSLKTPTEEEKDLKVGNETASFMGEYNANTAGYLLQQATYAFIASQLLSKKEKESIDEIFRAMDVNEDGKLSKEEIQNGYVKFFGRSLDDEEFDKLFSKVDLDGAYDYSELVVATMNEKNMISNSKLESAFKMFD